MKVQDANFVNALNGKVSGVTITQSAGGAGGTSKILLRGNKSVMGNNSPLIVVDGIPMTNQVGKSAESNWDSGSGLGYSGSSEGGDALSLINPDDIESINVLKGANAAALYGSAAANGVLMITTKKGKRRFDQHHCKLQRDLRQAPLYPRAPEHIRLKGQCQSRHRRGYQHAPSEHGASASAHTAKPSSPTPTQNYATTHPTTSTTSSAQELPGTTPVSISGGTESPLILLVCQLQLTGYGAQQLLQP